MTLRPADAAGAAGTTGSAQGLPVTTLPREARQQLGYAVVMATCSLLRNARSYAEDNAVFLPALQQLQQACTALITADGAFELQLAEGGVQVNREQVRVDAATQPLVDGLAAELTARGLVGMRTQYTPPLEDLRGLVFLFTPGGTRSPDDLGDPRRPLRVMRMVRRGEERAQRQTAGASARLVDAYAHAVYFVERTIAQLRAAGDTIPTWAASRVVQDMVDLQAEAPGQFLQLCRIKPLDDYWGHHAANTAVLAVSFGARLGASKRRKHDLGMAALLHDVGTAALPTQLLAKSEPLSEREMVAVKASPLFAARAILRDREVHAAALERAMAAYECHLDLVPMSGEPLPEIGLPGRILALCEAFDALTTARPFRPARSIPEALRVMQTELVFRFDPRLLDLFPGVVAPLL